MSLVVAVESFTERLEELKPLLVEHARNLDDWAPLDPQYEVYFHLEQAGKLLFVTLRREGQLIGYFIGFIGPSLHHKVLTLHQDIFYTAPAHRDGSPRAGLLLFRAVEREARARGVRRMFLSTKLERDAGPLFERLGFVRFEAVYTKALDEG